MKLLASVLLLVLSISLIPGKTYAQSPAVSPATSTAQSAPQTVTTEYTLPPDKLAKSTALYNLRGKLRIIGTLYGLLILVGLLYLGVAAKFRDIAEKAAGKKLQVLTLILIVGVFAIGSIASIRAVFNQKSLASKLAFLVIFLACISAGIYLAKSRSWAIRYSQALIFVPLILITTTILQLPLDAYQQSISLKYGLSVQGWGSWLGDVGKGWLVGFVILSFLAWLITTLIRKSPRRWWLYSWMCTFAVVVFVIFISPYVIDPFFNKFEPLDQSNPQLVTALQQVTHRGGLDIPRDRMFLMKASEKVTTLNAYVTGFGPSKRVVVWDTTIKNATTPETLFVFGHEMGHYVLNHVVIGMVAAGIGLFIGFFLLYCIANWAFPRFQQRWRMRELSDWSALVMLCLIFSIMSELAAPIGNGFSRQLEHNADIYGLEVTHGINPNPQEAAAHAFQVLGELALSYPYPSKAVVFWYADHPPIPDRVPFAHSYDPWSKGEPPKYVK